MPTFDGRNDNIQHFEDFFMKSLKVYPEISKKSGYLQTSKEE